MDHVRQPGLETQLGCFDTYSLEITSIFSKAFTDEPATLESRESVLAWMTMIHEWTHFMQFCSTTYGLFVTINRLSQQNAFTQLCRSIVEAMKSHGDQPILHTPLLDAIKTQTYPDYLKPIFDQFISEWWSAEIKLRSNFGYWTAPSGELIYQTLTAPLLANLRRTKIYAGEPLTVGHIVEPIAVGCAGQWFIQEFGIDAYEIELPGLVPLGLTYTLIPAIETELGINYATRMVLHDLALMLPVQNRATGNKPVPRQYSPPSRLIAALELLSRREVEQVPDSEPSNYLKLADQLSRKLDWPDYHSLVRNTLDLLASIDSVPSDPGLPRILEDFSRAFTVRQQHPDAFVCLTEPSIALYNSGWQPVWKQSEGWLMHDSQSREVADVRLMFTLAAQFVKSVVLGQKWQCPFLGQCENSGEFPYNKSIAKYCPCIEGAKVATGGIFGTTEIKFIKDDNS